MSSSSTHTVTASPLSSSSSPRTQAPSPQTHKRRRIDPQDTSAPTHCPANHRQQQQQRSRQRTRSSAFDCQTNCNKCNNTTHFNMHTHPPRHNSSSSTPSATSTPPSASPTMVPAPPHTSPMSPSTSLRAAIRKVQHTPHLPDKEKQKRIHQLFIQLREKNVKKQSVRKHGVFPGKGARRGCDHYQRKCWLKAKCCGNFYPCRRCHDEHEDHEIDRHATEQIACTECGKVQKVAQHCEDCGVQFARYFCAVCKFYDDTEGKEAYHCDRCGICRVGKGLGIDNYHCEGCDTCVPLSAKDDHPCRDRSLDANCPICTEYLQTSTDPVVFMRCGHTMHTKCLEKHTRTAYTCPLCHKCLTDMTDYYNELDAKIATEVIQPEHRHRKSHILCYDCDEKSIVQFHLVFHKCGNTQCGGYNTRVLSSFDQQSDNEDDHHNNTHHTHFGPTSQQPQQPPPPPPPQAIQVTTDGDAIGENP